MKEIQKCNGRGAAVATANGVLIALGVVVAVTLEPLEPLWGFLVVHLDLVLFMALAMAVAGLNWFARQR